MSAGTKIFLALFGLFVLLVVFYYGLWTPGDPDGDDLTLDINTPATGETTQSPASRDGAAPSNAKPITHTPQANRDDLLAPANAGGAAGWQTADDTQDEIRMGGKIGLDGPLAANAAMEITGDQAAQANSLQSNIGGSAAAQPSTRKSVDLVAVAQYRVEDGDTLSNIALRWFGDAQKWDLIVAVNPGLDADALRLGQMLKLPERTATRPQRALASPMPTLEAPTTTATTYTVRPDDSLSTIAKQHYGKASKWALIYEANRSAIGPDPDVLQEGMKLTLPTG